VHQDNPRQRIPRSGSVAFDNGELWRRVHRSACVGAPGTCLGGWSSPGSAGRGAWILGFGCQKWLLCLIERSSRRWSGRWGLAARRSSRRP